VSLDQIELRDLRVANLAVGELPWQRRALERALAPSQLPCLPRRESCARRRDRLVDDRARVLRILFEELVEALVDVRPDHPLDPGVPELRLRLAFELRLAELHGNDGRQSFAHVLAFERLVLLEQA